jgi:hypothetical protein
MKSASGLGRLGMKSKQREEKLNELKAKRNKAITSLTNYKNSELPVSATAEYLTFVAGCGENSVEVRYQNENIWLTQKMMCELYGVDRSVIGKHLKKIFSDGELEENSVCAIFAHTADDGKTYKVKFYALQAVIAVGFKIDNQRAVQFRKWIIHIVFDAAIAKNYLSEKEIDFLNRLVSLYLDFAEIQAENKIPMTMEDWAKRLDGFIEFNGSELLAEPGKITAEQAKLHAETQFEKYRIVQDGLFESDFDRFVELEERVERDGKTLR